MKKLLLYFLILGCYPSIAQTGLFINGDVASFRVDSTGFLSVNGDFQNLKCDIVKQVRFNGTLYLAGSLINNDSLKFNASSGSGNSKIASLVFRTSSTFSAGSTATIGGNARIILWETVIDKPAGSITLQNDVYAKDTLEFKNGFIFMNGRKWNLTDPVGAPSVINHPYIKKENRNSRFMPISPVDTGNVIYHTRFSSGSTMSPANIGIVLTGTLDLHSKFSIIRGFNTQVNAAKTSVQRYFDLYSTSYSLESNTIHASYNFRDLTHFNSGYINPGSLQLFISQGGDMNWSGLKTQTNTYVGSNFAGTDSIFSSVLDNLSHPNVNIDGRFLRITVADADCVNPPLASFLSDTIHICKGDSIILDAGNNTSIPNTSLKWEWYTSPAHLGQTIKVAADSTFQKLKVLLKDARGCTSVDSIIIAPEAPFPVVRYFNHLNACLGDSITIKDTIHISSGTYSNSWSYSDATSGAQMQNLFRKKFGTPGLHAIGLTVTSNYGCTVAATATNVIVYAPPIVSFTSYFDCFSGLMNFTSTAVSNNNSLVISSNSWHFGQGNPSVTGSTPSFSYANAGYNAVKLISTSSFGCRDSIMDSVLIHPKNSALFSAHNSCFTDTVHLNNLSVCNTGNCSVLWDLGDATNSSSNTISKIYSAPGLYTIKLKLLGAVGCADSLSKSIFINPKPYCSFSAATQSVCENNILYFTNTSSVSTGSISSNVWDYGNSQNSTQVHGYNTYTVPGANYASLKVESDSGCADFFQLPIIVYPKPVAHLSANTVCETKPTSLLSISQGSIVAYHWDFGDGGQTTTTTINYQNHVYSLSGIYSPSVICISSFGCSDTASAQASILQNPVIGLGASVNTCGESYTINANNPGATYKWSPGGQTTQTIMVIGDGHYYVQVLANNGCFAEDSVKIKLNDVVKPYLGTDTTACGEITLDAGYPGSNYTWSNGNSQQKLKILSSGQYSVLVIDGNGCSGGDTIDIQIIPPALVDLGADIKTCARIIPAVLTPTTNGTSFLWNGGQNTKTFSPNASGTFWLKVISSNGCMASDTIKLIIIPNPTVNLGGSKSACGYVLLDAQNAGFDYEWRSGEKTRTVLAISSAIYHVKVINPATGCSQTDSAFIKIFPVVKVNLGPDTTVCSGSKFNLLAGNPGSEYLWSNGSTKQQITISSSGVYGVNVSSPGGCSGSDYVTIKLIPSPVLDIGSSIQYLCGSRPVALEANHDSGLLWESSTGLFSTQPKVFAYNEGKYWATVSVKGCQATDTAYLYLTSNTIQASFLASTQDTINKPVQFINLSTPEPVSQVWTFGDGNTSADKNPAHVFVLPKTFSVSLEVSNGFCTDKITKEINVLFRRSAVENILSPHILTLIEFQVYPNPAAETLHINFELNEPCHITARVFDITGKLVRSISNTNEKLFNESVNTGTLSNGLYILSVSANSLKGNINRTVKFIKN
jgi:PKD repeat protein